MLLPQFTRVAPTPTGSLRPWATVATSTALFRAGAVAGVSRRPRQQQQNRGFRLGLWASYLDPNYQKILQRRHRVIKHKYAQALDRRRSWEREEPAREQVWNLKGVMLSHWQRRDPRPSGRWVNMDELVRPKSDPSVLDKMMQNLVCTSKRMYGSSAFSWSWPTDQPDSTTSLKSNCSSEKNFKASVSSNPSEYREQSADSISDLDWSIDPITNRKIFKDHERKETKNSQSRSEKIPVKTFKGYRSQFSAFAPPTQSETSGTIHLDGPSIPTCGGGKKPQPPKELFKSNRTDQLVSSVVNGNLGGSITDPVINFDGPPLGGELDDYKPFKHNEPDGKVPEEVDPIEKGLSEYDRKAKMEWMEKPGFSPFMYNEPDGQLLEKKDFIAKGLDEYDQSSSIKWLQQEGFSPFMYNEPDGQLPKEPDSVSDALNEYDSSPRGKWLKDPEDSSPFMYNEPDGKPPLNRDTVAESLNEYDRSASGEWLNKESSSPFMYNEPDGQLPVQKDPVQEALKGYDQGPISVGSPLNPGRGNQSSSTIPTAQFVVEPSLSRPQKSWQHRLPSNSREQDEDLDLLRASDIRASSGIMKGPKKETEVEKNEKRRELENDFYKSQELESSVAEDIAAAAKVIETRQSEGVAGNKLTGNFVRDFPEEFQASWTRKSSADESLVPKSTGSDAWGYDKLPKGLEVSYQQELENGIQTAENDYAAEHDFSRSPNPSRLQTALERRHDTSKQRSQAESDQYSKEPIGLELSYVNECVEQGEVDPPIYISSYGAPAPPIDTEAAQPSGVRSRESKLKEEKKHRDRALIREVRSIYESTYGTIDCAHRQVPESSDLHTQSSNQSSETEQSHIAPQSQEIAQAPTLYKILAYDPVMQSINFAETTSLVPDTSSALTPADVLLRLSNPAKFFPHFKSLQSQGYEIASGSGDVLVFRKVRDATQSTSSISDVESSSTEPFRRQALTNPIDGMQIIPPATGNFASPTGFVNHDLPEPPTESFISGIDVRREEPVFSGRRSEWEDHDNQNSQKSKQKPRRALKGFALGAAWVAACSYAVGVVAEFFRTGGADGKGPVGL